MREEICPECQGCGYLEVVVGSYYSHSFGNYLPREECVRCGLCGGTGLVEAPEEEYATEEELVPA
ncbi:molecular chaperone DnaJ [Calidithermus timidus]|uniref:molecular chaperone DnaJ n=1 Tax=Calidithermus timidus TaxID=307124 RepID=UPI00039C3023|nr:molecular chaperone DnaJ [Calidithermus timidus]